jgi:hypothetical protein
MKLILRFFEELPGLKINFHKSEIFCFGKAKEEEEEYKQIFGLNLVLCPSGIWVFQFTIER